MCFNNKRLNLFTILWYAILPIGAILCDTILLLGAIPVDTILPFGAILFDTVLPLCVILFKKRRCNKEVGWTNCFGKIRDKEDLLVDSNDNRWWREDRVWLNVVKYIASLGEVIL